MEILSVQCPFCLEWNDVPVEDEPPYQTIIDCAVCCHPLELQVKMDDAGGFVATAERGSGFE